MNPIAYWNVLYQRYHVVMSTAPQGDVQGSKLVKAQAAWQLSKQFCMSDSRVSGLDGTFGAGCAKALALPECSLQGWGQGLAIGRNTYGVVNGAQRCQEVINKITPSLRVKCQASKKLTVLEYAEDSKRSRLDSYQGLPAEGISGIRRGVS